MPRDPARLYLGNCATCHQASGQGTPDGYYPLLLHYSTVGATNPTHLIQMILHGVQRNAAGNDVRMPGFAQDLTHAQIAAWVNYVTRQFGNLAVSVVERDVAKLR